MLDCGAAEGAHAGNGHAQHEIAAGACVCNPTDVSTMVEGRRVKVQKELAQAAEGSLHSMETSNLLQVPV